MVGYAQNVLREGFVMSAPQFVNIGTGADIPIQSIKAVGEDTSDNVYIQLLDAHGYTTVSYAWNDWASDEPCWVNDDYEPVKDVTFHAGQGLWMQGTSALQGVQSAGKVGSSDVVVTLQEGFVDAGNPFPVAIDLQDIVAEGQDASDNVYIQLLDAHGYTTFSYSWNDWASDEPCWVNDDYEPVVGASFAAGQGLWIQGTTAAQSIRFPAPEL